MKLENNTENTAGSDCQQRFVRHLRYFGYATFEEYYQSHAAKLAHAPVYQRPFSKAEVMSRMLKKVTDGVWESVVEWVRRELLINPKYRTSPVWYFVMPECRALIPADVLQVADSVGLGIPLPNA